MTTALDLATTGTLALAAGAGAWLDWRERRLPNWLCGAALAAGLLLVAGRQGLAVLPLHLAHAGIALLVGMALFAGGLIGGGDAKYYSSLAIWFPLSDGGRLLLLVALAGLVLTLALWALFWRSGQGGVVQADGARQPRTVPYGVAIAAGAVIGQVW